jgi:hypothetical protein
MIERKAQPRLFWGVKKDAHEYVGARLTYWDEVMEVMGMVRESRNNPPVVPGGTVKEI